MVHLKGLILASILTLAIIRRISAQLQQGVATFYGGPQDNTSPYVASFGLLDGACGYKELSPDEWPYWKATAIGPGNPVYSIGNMKGCGYCIQAVCTGGCNANASALTVLVTDTCDQCSPVQLNIHSLDFQQYFQADLSVGRVPVQWQKVPCMPPGSIQARVVDSRAGNGGFLAVALFAVAGDGTVANLEIQSSGQSDWSPMTNSYGAVWQASNLGSPPFSLRITGSSQQLVALGAIPQVANGIYPTRVQFGSTGPPAATPAGISAPIPSAAAPKPASRNSTAPAPQPSKAPAPAPNEGGAPAPSPHAASPPTSASNMGGNTTLTLNSNLTGVAGEAGAAALNSTVTLTGRRLSRALPS